MNKQTDPSAEPVKVAKEATTGDKSASAATANREVGQLSVIPIATPATLKNEQDQNYDFVGDKLLTIGNGIPVIKTPEDPAIAYNTYRLCPYLEPIISALCANVYGADFTLRPIIDLEEPTAKDEIRKSLVYQKTSGDLDAFEDVTDVEVDTEIDRIKHRMNNEFIFLNQFFTMCCTERSYRESRILLGQDREISGTAYWEIVRNTTGKPAMINWVPAWSIKATPPGPLLAITEKRKVTPYHTGDVTRLRRFRSFVQLDSRNMVVARFKEFGDPRVMSRTTGTYYKDITELCSSTTEYLEGKIDPDNQPQPATELLHFSIPYPGSTIYGKPLWSSQYPGLIGSRDLDEHNRLVVTDQNIPQLLLLVGGGVISQADIDRMTLQISTRKPGQRSILILHAISQDRAPTGPSLQPEIKVERTKDAQHTDGLGLNYKERVYKEVRIAYRMPKVALGDDEGTDRATALTMQRYAEGQVYDPRRDDFDDRINNTIVPDLGILFWKYKTLSREPKDPKERAEIIEMLMNCGALSPDEGRDLSEEIFNRNFDDFAGAWAKLPTKLLIALLQTKNKLVAGAVMTEEDLAGALREAFKAEATNLGLKAQAKKKPAGSIIEPPANENPVDPNQPDPKQQGTPNGSSPV